MAQSGNLHNISVEPMDISDIVDEDAEDVENNPPEDKNCNPSNGIAEAAGKKVEAKGEKDEMKGEKTEVEDGKAKSQGEQAESEGEKAEVNDGLQNRGKKRKAIDLSVQHVTPKRARRMTRIEIKEKISIDKSTQTGEGPGVGWIRYAKPLVKKN